MLVDYIQYIKAKKKSWKYKKLQYTKKASLRYVGFAESAILLMGSHHFIDWFKDVRDSGHLRVFCHWDEGWMEDVLSPKTILDNKKTPEKSFLSQMLTCDDLLSD